MKQLKTKLFLVNMTLYGVALGLCGRVLSLPFYYLMIVITITALVLIFIDIRKQKQSDLYLVKYVEAHMRACKIEHIREVCHYREIFEVSIHHKRDGQLLREVFAFKDELTSRQFFCGVLDFMSLGKCYD